MWNNFYNNSLLSETLSASTITKHKHGSGFAGIQNCGMTGEGKEDKAKSPNRPFKWCKAGSKGSLGVSIPETRVHAW